MRWSAENGYLEIVKYIIEKEGEIGHVTDAKNSALVTSACNGHIEIVKYLISRCKTDDNYALVYSAENGADVRNNNALRWSAKRSCKILNNVGM